MSSDPSKRARQSRLRVRSGVRLVAGLLFLAAVGAVFDVTWLVKLALAGAAFFTSVTALEVWNARRWEAKIESE